MRRRRKRNRKLKIFTLLAAVISVSGIIAYKTFPLISRAAFTVNNIDFSSDPDSYTGENYFDYFNIFGENNHVIESEEKQTFVYADAGSDPGPKPYPTEWNEGDGVVSPTAFERYTGDKYIGLQNGGQVKNETSVLNSLLIAESKEKPDFRISFDGTPQVLIMHTHTTESFEPFERKHFDTEFNYRTTESSKNVVMIGNKITEQLEDAGIGVIHDTTIHDFPSYNGSYERSAETVNKILKNNPTIKVVLDIHRDALGTSDDILQPTVTVKGKKAAQIMIISGCDDGTLNMPDYMKNFRFACLLQQQFESDYNGFTRPVLFDYRKYNQDITTGSLLIEVGSHGNTLEQVEYSGELIGKSLVKALKELEE